LGVLLAPTKIVAMYGRRFSAWSLHVALPQKRQTPQASLSSKKHFTV
jgi:hypothetical protein